MTLELPPGPLVETDWLAAHLGHPSLRIVDMRGVVLPPTAPKPHYFARHEDYAAGHIPGAVYIDWTRDIVDLDDPVLVQVAPPAKIARELTNAELAMTLWWSPTMTGIRCSLAA